MQVRIVGDLRFGPGLPRVNMAAGVGGTFHQSVIPQRPKRPKNRGKCRELGIISVELQKQRNAPR